jgi:hypothetical protein
LSTTGSAFQLKSGASVKVRAMRLTGGSGAYGVAFQSAGQRRSAAQNGPKASVRSPGSKVRANSVHSGPAMTGSPARADSGTAALARLNSKRMIAPVLKTRPGHRRVAAS